MEIFWKDDCVFLTFAGFLLLVKSPASVIRVCAKTFKEKMLNILVFQIGVAFIMALFLDFGIGLECQDFGMGFY